MKELFRNRYADVILPLALSQLYTYSIPDSMSGIIKPGQRVVVQFGKSRMYTAVVYSIHERAPEHYDTKELLELLDSQPVITEFQFRLWEWMAEYYLCTLGEIMTAALPSVMKLQSETVVSLNPEFTEGETMLLQEEQQLVNQLSQSGNLSVADASKLIGLKNGLRLVRNLMSRNILIPHEEMQDVFRPRKITYLKLSARAEDDKFMQEIFTALEKRAPKQLHALMSFLQL